MLEEDNTNMFRETISKEESEIIDFINERELYYETLTRNEILLEVEKKFGNKGKEVLTQLTEDISVTSDDLECEECGKMSKELMAEADERLKLIDIAFDNEFDVVVKYILDRIDLHPTTFNTVYISMDLMIEAIMKFTNYKAGKIPEDVIHKVQIKIMFNGIQKGWLIDDIFE